MWCYALATLRVDDIVYLGIDNEKCGEKGDNHACRTYNAKYDILTSQRVLRSAFILSHDVCGSPGSQMIAHCPAQTLSQSVGHYRPFYVSFSWPKNQRSSTAMVYVRVSRSKEIIAFPCRCVNDAGCENGPENQGILSSFLRTYDGNDRVASRMSRFRINVRTSNRKRRSMIRARCPHLVNGS